MTEPPFAVYYSLVEVKGPYSRRKLSKERLYSFTNERYDKLLRRAVADLSVLVMILDGELRKDLRTCSSLERKVAHNLARLRLALSNVEEVVRLQLLLDLFQVLR